MPVPPPSRGPLAAPPRTFPWFLWGGALSLILLVATATSTRLTHTKHQLHDATLLRAQGHSRALEQNISGAIAHLDLALGAAVDHYRRLRARPRFDEEGYRAFLLGMRPRLSYVEGFRASDAQGTMRFGNEVDPMRAISIADRPYFLKLKAEPRTQLVISDPLFGRISQRWMLVFARRLEGPKGEFEGVVYATILLEQFAKTFEGMPIGPRDAIVLRGADDQIIVRHPFAPALGAVAGRKTPPPAFRALVDSGGIETTFTIQGTVDGLERTYAVRKIGPHPLYILVGLARQDELDALRREAWNVILLLVPFLAVTLGGALILHRTWARQQETLASLAQHEQRFRQLFESVGDAIYIQDLQGHLLELNQAALDRMSLDKGSLAPGPGGLPLELEQRLRTPEILTMMKDQDEALFETTQSSPNGDLLHMEIRSRRIDYEGQPAILNVARDITERRRMDRLKEEFISLVSHELRTPLTSIKGSLGLALGGVSGAVAEGTQSLLDIAARNTEQLIRIVDDLLDLQRMERGMMAVTLSPTQLPEILQEAIRVHEGYDHPFGVTYALECSGGPLTVKGDASRLQQVMANLLSNATKHSPPNGVVRVMAEARGPWARVEVWDSGPGIAEAFRPHVFHKFAQAKTGNTRSGGGTGLGLSITKALIELHGGRIGFHCPPGGGTQFWFELPLDPPPGPSAGPE